MNNIGKMLKTKGFPSVLQTVLPGFGSGFNILFSFFFSKAEKAL